MPSLKIDPFYPRVVWYISDKNDSEEKQTLAKAI